MPALPALERQFDALRRGAVCGLRTLQLLSIILFTLQPAGALAAHHAGKPGAAEIGFSDTNVAPPEAAQTHDAGWCQPAEELPACPDCTAVSCGAAPATLVAATTIRIFQRPLRHLFFEPALALSSHIRPPELGPPRA